MNLSQLHKAVRRYHKRHKRRGCGDSCGHGGTSCRGGKGQSARSGFHQRNYFEGGQMPLIRKTPKRGFNNTRFQDKVIVINLRDLNRFANGDTINEQTLREKGLIKGEFDRIKILGNGNLERENLILSVHSFSESAVKKIQEKGGKVTPIAIGT
ncbi:MAG: 50S ribosomal protein L15 [Planctomycetota bacterium]|nr:50S ribosomal protein L15 [Planctomycetota bacterium]MDI6787481.1 50S ribosomal protein L15 [Planctomycetota bacterium]